MISCLYVRFLQHIFNLHERLIQTRIKNYTKVVDKCCAITYEKSYRVEVVCRLLSRLFNFKNVYKLIMHNNEGTKLCTSAIMAFYGT